jgi:hypothetical protein
MSKGFQPGDPRAVAAAKKGAQASKRVRRRLMLARFEALTRGNVTPFRAFLLGWREHRAWSARRRFQMKDRGFTVMGEWQPIKTAPKDWSHVIVYDHASCAVGEAYYRAEETVDDSAWCWSNLSLDDEDAIVLEPTHWMPLPEHPQ